jgi:hypothetical protein
LSRYVGCIINELEASEIVDNDFGLFAIFLKVDESGEIESTESIVPIGKVGFDIESEECLLHASPGGEAITISDAYAELTTIDSGFSLVSALEQKFDDSWVRIDYPVIGFGENIDEKRFYIACKA